MKTYKFISAIEVDNYDAAIMVEDVEEIDEAHGLLVDYVNKKLKQGITPDFDQLAASSHVSKILTMIDKELLARGCPKMTKEARKEMRHVIANNVLYYVYY